MVPQYNAFADTIDYRIEKYLDLDELIQLLQDIAIGPFMLGDYVLDLIALIIGSILACMIYLFCLRQYCCYEWTGEERPDPEPAPEDGAAVGDEAA